MKTDIEPVEPIESTVSRNYTKKDLVLSWLVHFFTATGIFFALFSINALYDGRPGDAINWLLLTLVIDGIDGPMSRAVNVVKVCPKIDGVVLDLVVDYVTYVLIPALFMLELEMFPENIEVFVTGLVLFVGALYFARTDMKTHDKWFTGFPGTWNFVAISLWLVGTSQIINVLLIMLFVVLSASNILFFHFVRSKQLRPLTLGLTIAYIVAILYMVNIEGELDNTFGRIIIYSWFIYTFGMSIWRTWFYHKDADSKDFQNA